MVTAARRVRHLRLRAASEGAVRRAELTLRDAMRTASLHDEGSRLVLVRRLALGRLRPRARADQVARTLEVALAEVAAEGRHGSDPTAGSAGMVWFRDALEAHLALARRLLSGPPPGEWYWPLVAPGWKREMDAGTSLRVLTQGLAARPEAPAALPAWVGALVRDGHARAVIAALRPDDVRLLARALGWPAPPQATDRPAVAPGPVAVGPPGSPPPPGDTLGPTRVPEEPEGFVEALVRSALKREGEGATPGVEADARIRHEPPTDSPRREVVELSPKAAVRPRDPGDASRPDAERAPAASVESTGAPASPDLTLTLSPSPPDTEPPARDAPPHPGPDPVLPRSGVELPPDRPAAWSSDPSGTPAVPAALSAWPGLEATEAGGLAFLLNVLVRLGYEEWLERHPGRAAHGVAQQVLARLLDALAVSEEDPLREVVRRGPSGPPGPVDTAWVRAWSLAVHRWLRLHTRMRVAEVVLRPGRIAATRTHLDVWFDPELCDLRIRRVGLDLDPGWLPWMGRVVAFHYQAGGG